MRLYGDFLLPACYDLIVDRAPLRALRKKNLREVRGEVLEIGAGTGLNLPAYPNAVRRITAVDPNPGMRRRLVRRAARSRVEVELVQGTAEALPVDDRRFDCVVSTLVLCCLPDPAQALGEILRVLKPGGAYFFCEHGLANDPGVQRWQRRLTPWQRRLGDGCRLDLPIDQLLQATPFASLQLERLYLRSVPRVFGYITRGRAVKQG